MAKKNMTREHPAQQEPAEDNLTRKGPGAPGRGGRGGARLGAALSLGVVVLVVLSLASLAVGNSSISTTDALSALVGTSSNGTASLIVWGVRVPRTLAALACGAALAGSGLLLQSSLDNDLAAPSIMGVNSGAGLGALVAALLVPQAPLVRAGAAFAGALLSTLAVYLISRKAGVARTTLVLAGVAVSSLMSAGVDVIITVRPDLVTDRVSFSLGSFSNVSPSVLAVAAPVMAFAVVAAFLLSSGIDLFALGDEAAYGLGLDVRRHRLLSIGCSALLSAAAVSVCGLLGFVGLIVPNLVRMRWHASFARCLAGCLVGGAALVLGCDLAARMLFFPYELPVGLLLSLLGAPFFIMMLVRRHQRGRA